MEGLYVRVQILATGTGICENNKKLESSKFLFFIWVVFQRRRQKLKNVKTVVKHSKFLFFIWVIFQRRREK
jgi:hypothetical protein